MTAKCFGVTGESQPYALFGSSREPVLLFGHGRGVRSEKGKSIESSAKFKPINFFRLCVMDDLTRSIETLQGKRVNGEISVGTERRCKTQGAVGDLTRLFVLPLQGIDNTQSRIRSVIPGVAVDPLLIGLGCFLQLSGHIQIVVGGDRQLFPLADLISQLKGLAEVRPGSVYLAETGVVQAQRPVGHCKVRIKVEHTLKIRQGCRRTLLTKSFQPLAVLL